MKSFQKIMAACDLSDYSEKVLMYASDIANRYKSFLYVVNVINQANINAVLEAVHEMALVDKGAMISVDTYIQKNQKDRESQIQKIITKIGFDTRRTKIIIKSGIPYQKLIATVREEEIDLVVMGTKGRTNLTDVMFGSTAEKMFRLCPAPLLSVRFSKK